MKIKVLLINAINPHNEVERRQPSLGLGYLASSLRKVFGEGFFEFRMIDNNVEKETARFKPDVVFISSVTQNFNIAINYGRLLKRSGLPVVVGGIHISMMPSSLEDCFDAGVIGEGEETVVELMEVFLEDRKFVPENLKKVKGIVFNETGSVCHTEARPETKNLDSISSPAKDLLNIHEHTYMFTSRGCPYDCTFCASTRFWPNVRFFSAEYVVKEMRELVDNYKVGVISFYDDLFIADRERLKAIVSCIKKDAKLKKLKFTCSARANLVNDEVVALLKEMNIGSINLGLESGCEKTLKYLKGDITVEQNLAAIKIIKKHGIACQGSFIIGSPFETEEEIMETYGFIKKAPLNLVDIYVLTPYPGTPVWDHAVSKGLVSEKMDWNRLNVNFGTHHEDAIILSETLAKERIVMLFRKFQRLCLTKNIMGIPTHPYFKDIPKVAAKLISEGIHRKWDLILRFFNAGSIGSNDNEHRVLERNPKNGGKVSVGGLTGVVKTLLFPIWARHMETKRTDGIINDPKSVEIMESLDCDFSGCKPLERSQVAIAIRTEIFDEQTSKFIKNNPKAVVVNLGCGLDTRFPRMDNGLVEWYDLDVPEAIEIRRHFFTENDRFRFISKSVFDFSWISEIPKGRRTFFIAEGLLMYFPGEEVKRLIFEINKNFPGSELVLEAVSFLSLVKSFAMNVLVKDNIRFKWGVETGKELEKWSEDIEFAREWHYLDRHPGRWRSTRIFRYIPLFNNMLKIIHLKMRGFDPAHAKTRERCDCESQ